MALRDHTRTTRYGHHNRLLAVGLAVYHIERGEAR